jgi:hypothetical protein
VLVDFACGVALGGMIQEFGNPELVALIGVLLNRRSGVVVVGWLGFDLSWDTVFGCVIHGSWKADFC